MKNQISCFSPYPNTCVLKWMNPLENSIVIDDVSSSSLDKVFSASPPPPMPSLLLYILTLEGNTFTSGKGWPKSSVLSLVFSVSVLPSICYHEIVG